VRFQYSESVRRAGLPRVTGIPWVSEIMQATGWQAHSVRGFLSTAGKKRGLNIESSKNDAGACVYQIYKEHPAKPGPDRSRCPPGWGFFCLRSGSLGGVPRTFLRVADTQVLVKAPNPVKPTAVPTGAGSSLVPLTRSRSRP